MLTRTSISALLLVAVVVWGAFLWLLGIQLTWDHAKPFSLTLAALTSAWWLFNKYLWNRWPCTRFGNPPDLTGTWRVELKSSYKSPAGDAVPAVKAYAVVRQTYSTLSIRLMTEQSESHLVASSVDQNADGTTFIYGVYQSDPSILLRSKVSEIHYGSFKYKVIGCPPSEVIGHYWTDRSTNGSIRFYDRAAAHHDSFASAEAAGL